MALIAFRASISVTIIKYFWKYIVSSALMLACCSTMIGQTPDNSRNYVSTTTYLDNGFATSIQYFDGLGRPSEQVQHGLGSNGEGAISKIENDLNGREAVKWLPRPIDGEYSDPYPFSQTTYDALNRPVFVSTPGEAWYEAGKGKTISYITNAPDEVKYYYTSNYDTSSLEDRGYEQITLWQ